MEKTVDKQLYCIECGKEDHGVHHPTFTVRDDKGTSIRFICADAWEAAEKFAEKTGAEGVLHVQHYRENMVDIFSVCNVPTVGMEATFIQTVAGFVE